VRGGLPADVGHGAVELRGDDRAQGGVEAAEAGLAKQLVHRALAVVIVRLRLAEPVHGPVAAGYEAVERHRHLQDQPPLSLGTHPLTS
jgi:hypothetical protein